jgi:hypothetical protein
MGKSHRNREALEKNNYNVETAMNWMFNNPETGGGK